MSPTETDAADDRDPAALAGLAQAALDAHLTRELDPAGGGVRLGNLMAGALADALVAIGLDRPDGSRVVAAAVARAAVPPSVSELIDQLAFAEGDPIDVSDPEVLAGLMSDTINEDESGYIEAFVEKVLEGSSIGEVWEDASYSPAHSSETLHLESFTWSGGVWYYGHGSPDVMESYEAEFLYKQGDEDDRRAALICLAGSWMGAGLECDDDPQVRRVARSESWLVQWDRFNWYDPLDDWHVSDTYRSAQQLIEDHAELIANRLRRGIPEVATVIRALKAQEGDGDEVEKAADASGHWGKDLPPAEQEVRKELWWILKRS